MKVLIVDDSAIVRVRLADLLHDIDGVESVMQAPDALGALDLMKTLKPDVAIVDVRMPKRSGIDLLEDVRRTGQSLKVIMLTNYPTPENREKCRSLGADYFFDKSSEIEQVINVLKFLQQDSRGPVS
ncbi:MAG TPA: response regulator transcription factor [Burkholderiales bacterium]